MGWWGQRVEARQPVLNQVIQINPEFKRDKIKAHCFKNFTCFIAYDDGDGIQCYVVLCRYGKKSGGSIEMRTKIMHENDGPYYYGATDKILDMLDPPKHHYATEWRKKCREYNAEQRQKLAVKRQQRELLKECRA